MGPRKDSLRRRWEMPEWGLGSDMVWDESLSDSRRVATWVGQEWWQ